MDKPQILPKQLTPSGNCNIHSTIAPKVLIVLPDLPLYPESGKENIHPHSSAAICG